MRILRAVFLDILRGLKSDIYVKYKTILGEKLYDYITSLFLPFNVLKKIGNGDVGR